MSASTPVRVPQPEVEASDASAGPIEDRWESLRRVITWYEQRAEQHQRRALEHGAAGRIELARRELELARWERGEAMVRRASLDDWDRTWSIDDADEGGRGRHWHVELAGGDDADELARRATQQLHGWGLSVVACDAAIAMAELVASADRRGRARVLGLVGRAGALTVEVHNDGAVVAPGRSRDEVVPRSTALALDALAADWGWRPTGTGICLWCQLHTV